MNEVLTALAERSSIRAYTEEKLTAQEIDTLIKAGLQAPTAANRQEVHFSVLEGSHPLLAEIDAERRRLLVLAKPEDKEAILNNPNNFYYGAPTLILLSADPTYNWGQLDSGIAVENIALAAHSMGLGSLIIGCIRDAMKNEKQAEFFKALDIPEGFEFTIAIAVGHKNTEKAPHTYDEAKSVSYIN